VAHSRLFVFFKRLARMVWGGAAAKAPALTRYFVRRALHHGRLAFFSRGPRVRGSAAAAAKKLLLNYYKQLAKGRWYRHPVWHRLDLMGLTGYLRRRPSLYRNTGFAGPDPPPQTVERLVHLRRYRAADRFVDRVAGDDKKKRSTLRLHHGIALVDMEQWQRAHAAFLQAAQLGSPQAWAELVGALVEAGKLGAAHTQLSGSGVVADSAPMLLAKARLERRRGHWSASLAAVKKALKKGAAVCAQRDYALALAATGKLAKAVTAFKAAFGQRRCGCAARADLARMFLRGGRLQQAADAARGLIEDAHCASAWGIALLAEVALARKQKALAKLLSERADYHAGYDPDALVAAARVLVRARLMPALAARMLKRALARRPFWSVPRALLARVFAEGGLYKAARMQLRVALRIKPADPAYRTLLRAILKAEGAQKRQ
jgi:tetratricopeptide (TPR) repeat protein